MKRRSSTILSFSFCLLPENTRKVLLADGTAHQLLLKVWSGGEDTLQPARRITVTMTAFGTQSKINF